MKTWIKETTN